MRILINSWCQADIEERKGQNVVIDTDDLVLVEELQTIRIPRYRAYDDRYNLYYREIRLKGINEPLLVHSTNKDDITFKGWEYENL